MKEVHDVATKFGVLPFVVGTVTETTLAMSGLNGGAQVEFGLIRALLDFREIDDDLAGRCLKVAYNHLH